MLRARTDVEFEELGTTDELEALNRGGSSTILDVSKVRAHLRQHHDLPSTASSLWPSVASHVTPSDAAKQHPPLFLVKLPPRCPSGFLSPSRPSVVPTHDPLSRSSLASPRKPRASRRSFKARHSSEFSISTTTSSSRGQEHSSGHLLSPRSSPISVSSSQSSSPDCDRTTSDIPAPPYHEKNTFTDTADRRTSPAASESSPSSSSSSSSSYALSSLPASSPRSRTISPHTNPLPLPRAHSDNTLNAARRARSFSCEVSTKHPTATSSSCTLTQRRPRSCHTSPQTALTLMDEYFLERIETHVSLLEKMRERCCDDGRTNGPVVAVTHWQHAEDYPQAWVSKLKELITDPRFPEPMYLETDADDDEVEGVLMSLIRNEDVCNEQQERHRVKSLSPYLNSKSPYHFCFGRMGSLIAIIILLVLLISISRWYTHIGAGTHDHAHVGEGPGHTGHGHESLDGH